MTTRARLPVAVVLAVLAAAGCPVFTSIDPCAVDDDCEAPLRCGADGFCGTVLDADDAGAPRDGGRDEDDGGVPAEDAGAANDAGRVDGGRPPDAGRTDAGRPPDSGAPADAGVGDAGFADAGAPPELRIDVRAQDPVAAGYVVGATVDLAVLGSAGALDLARIDGGAPVPFVLDPSEAPAATTRTVWLPLPAALATDAGASFVLARRAGGTGPSARLDAVFPLGDDFDVPPISPTLSLAVSGAATATVDTANGTLVVDMSAEADAAVVRTTSPFRRGDGVELRMRARVPFVGPTTDGIGSVLLFGIVEGQVPAPSQTGQFFFDYEVVQLLMAEDAMVLTVHTAGENYFDWNGTAWGVAVSAFAGPTTADVDLTFTSDGADFWFTIKDANGTLITQTAPFDWGDIASRTGDGNNTQYYVYWGDGLAGPGAPYYFGDITTDYIFARKLADAPPLVTVTVQ